MRGCSAVGVRLVAVRHGQTTLNAAGRLTGQLDPPLTAVGREQAAALGPVVAQGSFDRILHSGTRRAADTLRIACETAGIGTVVTPVADPRWRERSFGSLEGQPASRWREPPDLDAAPPGGESYRALAGRVLAALDDLHREAVAAGRPLDVLLCAHSGVLRVLAAIAGGVPDVEGLLAGGTRNGEILCLDYAAPSRPTFLARGSS